MTSILISLLTRQMANILNGKQTIIFLKTKPKCDLPIVGYGYCTHGKILRNGRIKEASVVWLSKYNSKTAAFAHEPTLNGHVLAKFTLRKIERVLSESQDTFQGDYDEVFFTESMNPEELLNESCMEQWEISDLWNYYACHISDLQIFPKPKDITEFYEPYECGKLPMPITKAPSSWRYIEAL